jgi:hypothetical protein
MGDAHCEGLWQSLVMAYAKHRRFLNFGVPVGSASVILRAVFCVLVGSASLMPESSLAQAHSHKQQHHHRSIPMPAKPFKTTELIIVDAQGRARLRFSAASKVPTFQMLTDKGAVGLEVSMDESNHPSISLLNPDGGSTASLAVDDKGAHVKFDRPGGATSYLFLNDEGVSGIVLADKSGKRRYELLLSADSSVTTRRFDDAGNEIP